MSIAKGKSGLTGEERNWVAALGRNHATRRMACIEALKYVQGRYRWVCNQHLGEVAALLEMPRAELEGVATFYNLVFRREVGEHVILLCDSVSCWIMGRDGLCAHFSKRLGISPGQTTKDGAYTLLPIVCLGHCDHAPAMLLDGTLHGDLDTKRLDELLDIRGK